MNPQIINKTVAETLGWEVITDGTYGRPPSKSDDEYNKTGNEPVPPYSISLDACREFEATITNQSNREDYQAEIWKHSNYHVPERNLHNQDSVARAIWNALTFATPLQRCEAFLRCREKWVTI